MNAALHLAGLPATGSAAAAILTIEAARKEFGGLVAVNDVSFDVMPGELLGLIGPNGSGKTTMLNLISGALKPTAGAISLEGKRISGAPAHVGIDTARAKVLLFVISGAFIGIIGAILAPRFAYIEPPSAFNPMISFQVVIMALLGGTKRLWGPLVGVIPFTIVFDLVSAQFPNHTSIMMGLAFLAVVYLIPNGITGWIEVAMARLRGGRTEPSRKTQVTT